MKSVAGVLLASVCVLTGCASQLYRDTPDGKFSGELEVRWVRNDYFLFRPSPKNPLRFVRSDKTEIKPGLMYTDGGSIPRFLWGVKDLSPWTYAPAYIVHDWLFEAQHCGYAPDDKYAFKDSVAVMAETLKAVMEKYPSSRNYLAFDAIVAGVETSIAKRLWDDGVCNAPGSDAKLFGLKAHPDDIGELITTIPF